MKRITYILAAFFLVVISQQSIQAQLKNPPKIEWQRSLGGSDIDNARSVKQTNDGGYVVAGYASSFDGDVNNKNDLYEYWVVKLSSTGLVEWKGLYGGNDFDVATSIYQAKDGSYIISGSSYSNDVDVKDHIGTVYSADFWIVKLKGDGVIDWERSLGGTSEDGATSILPTFDGGYIVVGSSNSFDSMVKDNHGGFDCWVVKLTDNGVTKWSRSYGGSEGDGGNSIQQTSDSGYVIAGSSYSDDGDIAGHHGQKKFGDYWIIKLSKEGEIEWQRSLGGSRDDVANDIKQTADGGYIVIGNSGSIDGDVNGHFGDQGIQDAWVLKLDSNGSIEWDRSLGGSSYDEANSVCKTSDGGYVIAGYTNSYDGNISFNHGGRDYWLVKLSKTGIIEWEKSLGGSYEEEAYSVQQTTDGGFIVVGYSSSNDGDVTENHGIDDYWVVKLSPENPTSVEAESPTTNNISISPNPAISTATLTLESDEEGICEVLIISVTGTTLKQYSTHLTIGKQEIALRELEALPAGMYEVLVKRNGYLIDQTKLIIE